MLFIIIMCTFENNYDMSLKQGSSLVTDAIDTPSYYKKVMVTFPESSITSNQCQYCDFEKMNLKIRSVEEKINGVGFNVDLQVKTNTKLGKVVDLFSRRTGLAMDRMEFRCLGRVLRLEEEVKGLQGETVLVSLVG